MRLLHPTARDLVRPFTGGPSSRRLLVLVSLAAIPLAAFAVARAGLQSSLVDEHSALEHYGTQSGYAIEILGVGVLASLKPGAGCSPMRQSASSV